jgi:metacaspase-1
MKFFLIVVFLVFGLHVVEAQTKRAIIIGIGTYPVESGWGTIHGDNDVPLISSALITRGFVPANIHSLINQKATKYNIVNSFKQLIGQAQLKDVVYIHFSTHGQQVVDTNGDEQDGLDEAIIPYDAFKTFIKGKYEGKNHLIDDELNRYLTAIRSKIGKTGSLLVVIDACHSGDATRGNGSENDTLMIRGTDEVFQIGKRKEFVPQNTNPIGWVVISASQSYQNNYEYKLNGEYFGSLSYAVKLALGELSDKEDFLGFFKQVKMKRQEMKVVRYPQTPMIEGDNYFQNQKVF